MESNVILKNVTFTWAKLAEAVKPFGKPVYEITVSSDNPHDDLQRFGRVREDKNGNPCVVLKKRADRADGSMAPKVTVVDADGKDIDPARIGNGSKGHCKVFMRPWEFNGKKGISATLMAIKLTELIEYRPSSGIIGFDDYEDEASDGNGGTVKVPATAYNRDSDF